MVLACATAVGVGARPPERVPLGTVVVGVAELGSGAPIPEAEVRFPDLRRRAITNWMGEASFADVPAGRHRLTVRRIGYAPSDASIEVGRLTTGPVFMLERLPATLDTVAVRERATPTSPYFAGFDARRRMGLGRFITDSMFEAERSNDLAVVLNTRLLGLQVRHDAAGRLTFGSNSCMRVDVYVDDLRDSTRDFLPVSPRELAGAEWYRSNAAPPQYRRPGGAECVLLLWRRLP